MLGLINLIITTFLAFRISKGVSGLFETTAGQVLSACITFFFAFISILVILCLFEF